MDVYSVSFANRFACVGMVNPSPESLKLPSGNARPSLTCLNLNGSAAAIQSGAVRHFAKHEGIGRP